MTAPTYSVQVDQQSLDSAIRLFEFIGGNTTKATRMAINASLTPVRKLAIVDMRKEIKLSATEMREAMRIDGSNKATNTNLVGKITTPKRGLLLSRFSTDAKVRGDKVSLIVAPKVPPRGIRVEVTPGSRLVVNGRSGNSGKPFYMILPKSRKVGIVQRRRTPGPRGGRIDVFHGPSISQVFQNVKERLLPEAVQIYEAKLIEKMNYVLRQQHPVEG